MNNITNIITPVTDLLDPLRVLIKNSTTIDIPNYILLLIVIVLVIVILINFKLLSNPMTKLNSLTGGKSKDQTTFILYYVEWCPHCQVVKPEWKKLEEDKELKHITISKINCEENEDIVKEKNIEGFPTILLTHNGKEIGYNGGREYADFKNYLLNL